MTIPKLPDAKSRWRCTRCGNLTRFDVIREQRANEFWHFDLAGDHSVEERELVIDDLKEVKCRWCGTGAAVELIARVEDE
jgi:hypothetical protein